MEMMRSWTAPSLKEITVSPDNPHFSSVGGVLFDRGGSRLVLVPNGLSGEYRVPDTVRVIGKGAFSECNNLTWIILPDSLRPTGSNAFEGCTFQQV